MRVLGRLSPWLFAAAILAVVALLVVEVERRVGSELDERAAASLSTVQREVDSNILTLGALRGLVLAEPRLDRAQWRAFLKGIAPLHRLETAQGFGFARAMRREGLDEVPQYLADYGIARGINPAGGTGPAFPIVLLEPDDARNRAALGFDMYSEAVRRAAMDRAARGNQPAVSGIVRLKQEVSGPIQPGFLIYVPVRGPGGRLEGFVYAPYRAEDFFRVTSRLLADQGFGLTVRALDGQQLFASGPRRGHRWHATLQIADQSWPVEVVIPRPLISTFALALSLLGVAIAVAAAALLTQYRRRMQAVEALASERERHLAETDLLMREMAHRLKNAFARVAAIAHLTGRQARDKDEFLRQFNARLNSLARSKEMLLHGASQGGSLHDLVVEELEVAAVPDPGPMVSGDRGSVGASEYWVAALAVHELVTNSIKYGALAKGGTLLCTVRTEGERLIVWHERLPHPIATGADGFGTDFVATLLERNLSGRAERHIEGHDLEVRLSWPVPAERGSAAAENGGRGKD